MATAARRERADTSLEMNPGMGPIKQTASFRVLLVFWRDIDSVPPLLKVARF